uniref:(northern house mosquito) hypothetical protein n=1 Tax=Culex pipiens TaxID=7175 RepID=A0A8D7ZV88_CULPI
MVTQPAAVVIFGKLEPGLTRKLSSFNNSSTKFAPRKNPAPLDQAGTFHSTSPGRMTTIKMKFSIGVLRSLPQRNCRSHREAGEHYYEEAHKPAQTFCKPVQEFDNNRQLQQISGMFSELEPSSTQQS